MDNPEEDISEVKHRLIEAVLALIGGANKVPRHDLPSLWKRHGELISGVVDRAGLTNDQLNAITDTADPGSFESIAHLAPLATQARKLAVFHAAATITVSLLTRARLVPTGPGTITGTPPPPRTHAPISAQLVELQVAQPVINPPTLAVQSSDDAARPAATPSKKRDDPQITSVLRPPPQTIISILESDLPSKEKRRLARNFAKKIGARLLCVLNVGALFVGAWYGMAYAAERLGRTGSILGFIVALIVLVVNGIPWWRYFEKDE